MEQIVSQGMSAAQLLQAGQQTTARGIPLGTYFEDGKRRYVWAHVADATPRRGVIVRKNGRNLQCVSVAGDQFTPAATVNGYGDATGNTIIRAYGLSRVSATWVDKLQDGYFEVLSGQGIGVYPVDWIQPGGTGYTKFRIRGGISSGLSTGSRGIFAPNPYYGCIEFALSGVGMTPCGTPAGACTQTATTSGYQLLQTKGYGLLKCATACVLSAGKCLMIQTSNISGATMSAMIVGQSLGKVDGSSIYCPADIFID